MNKNKLKKLVVKKKKELANKNLKSTTYRGTEAIKRSTQKNFLALPQFYPKLLTKQACQGAQAFYFGESYLVNQKTETKMRLYLQEQEGKQIVLGGFVSDYSKLGERIALQHPTIFSSQTSFNIRVDSHIWLKLAENNVAFKLGKKTVSLGDFLFVRGRVKRYRSKGKVKYSLTDWGIIYSGLLDYRLGTPDLTIKVKEDYPRVGWLYQTLVAEGKSEKFVQEMEKVESDKTKLSELYQGMLLIKEIVTID